MARQYKIMYFFAITDIACGELLSVMTLEL